MNIYNTYNINAPCTRLLAAENAKFSLHFDIKLNVVNSSANLKSLKHCFTTKLFDNCVDI